MFRRGPLRPHGFRRLMRAGGLLGERPRQMVRQANALEASGQFKDAAQLFAQLADGAAQNGMPDRAGNLSLQAARCFIEAGDTANGVSRVRQGIQWLQTAGRDHRAERALTQAVTALRARKLNAEADALMKEFAGVAAQAEAETQAEPEAAHHGHLPPKCPNCGGPMRVDDADWIDDMTAECPYCGTPVKAE